MGQIFIDTPNEGRILVNILGDAPTAEEERKIKEKFFSETDTSVLENPEVVPEVLAEVPEVLAEVEPVVLAEVEPVVETEVEPVVVQTEALLSDGDQAENYNAAGFLKELQRGVSATDLVTLMYEGGVEKLNVDGKVFDFKKQVDKNVSPQEIIDYLLTGEVVRDIGAVNSTLAGVNFGLTNLLGIPFEAANWVTRKLEQGAKKAYSAVTGKEVSLKPEDLLFSQKEHFLSGGNIRSYFREVGIDIPDSKREIPEEYRGLFQVGRVVGETAIPAFKLYQVALSNVIKLATTQGANMHPFIINLAKNPTNTRNAEVIATIGAAGGATVAESIAPDNPYWMMGAEIIGSMTPGAAITVAKEALKVTPLAMVGRGLKKVSAGVTTEAARKAAAQEILITLQAVKDELLETARIATNEGRMADAKAATEEANQYTVRKVLSELKNVEVEPTGFTNKPLPAGTATENSGLIGIQNNLMRTSDKFKAAMNAQISEALASMHIMSSKLLKGDGTSRMGELLRGRYIQTILKKEMVDKSEAIKEALERIPKGDMEAASVAVQNILREGKTNLRNMETFWWERVDKSIIVDASEVAKSIQSQKAKVPRGATIAEGEANVVLNEFLKRANNGDAINIGEVLTFRSYFLNLSRKAKAEANFSASDRYDEIAGSAIDVLNKLDGYDKDTIGMARAFSVRLNQTYNRYWIKDTLASASAGGTIKDPRLTLESATSGTAAETNLNLRDAQEAAIYTDSAAIGTKTQYDIDQQIAEAKKAASNIEPELNTLDLELTDQSDPTMYQAIKNFRQMSFEPTQTAKRMRVVDKPKNADEIADMDADGNIILDPIKPTANNTEAPINNFPDEGLYSLNNEDVYGQLQINPQKQSLTEGMNEAQTIALQNDIRNLADNASREGIPTTEALNRWLADNAALVERFPGVKARATELLVAQEDAAKLFAKIDNFKNTENFNNKVGEIFASDTPEKSFTQLADDIRTSANNQGIDPKKGLDQLRASTFDMMLTASLKDDGTLDFISLGNQLFAPMDTASSGLTRMDVMVQNGLMETTTSEAVAAFIFNAIRIEKSIETPAIFNQVMQDSETMINNIARLAGANIGVLFGRGDASLQAASIGSAFMKNLVDKLPRQKTKEQMEYLFLNPKIMAEYISKNPVIQKRATDTIKAGWNNVKRRVSDKGFVGASASYIWDGTKYVAIGATKKTINSLENPTSASVRGFVSDGDVDPDNLPSSLDNQMQEAFQ